jgi:hypothetical protein
LFCPLHQSGKDLSLLLKLSTLNIKRWLDVGSSESKAKGSFGQKEFYFSNMGETALGLKKSPGPDYVNILYTHIT